MVRYDVANRSGGKFLWLFQRLSGFILFFILLFHFFLLHFAVPEGEPLTFSLVMQRLSTPFWKTLDLVFLILALFHGLNGLWTVFGDYFHRSWVKVTLFCLVATGGLVLLVFGALTILTLPQT